MKTLSVADFKNSRVSILEIDSNGQPRRGAPSVHEQEWVLLTPAETSFHPDFFSAIGDAMVARPDASVFYFDSAIRAAGKADIVLNPAWDLTLFLAQNYIGLPILIKHTALTRLGGLDDRCGKAAVFDLLLRAHDAGLVIDRIEEILSFGPAFQAPANERRAVLQRWIAETNAPYAVENGFTDDTLKITRIFDEFPAVTLVVPTRQSADESGSKPFICGLLDSLLSSDYPLDKITVVVGDDLQDGSAYSQVQWPFRLTRIVTARDEGEPFNYAAKMNRLWRAASTEHVVLLNDDITVLDRDWLQSLLTYSLQEDVGGVGARLLYPNGRIQHAGMAGGVYGLCTHAWINEPADRPTYQDWAVTPKEWSMVTGAVFATRKSVLEEMNGFDERFTLDFNDVDLCMRIRMAGYRIVYTPHATLTHHEKGSRGTETWPGSQLGLFLERWTALLSRDPSFNKGLTKSSHIVRPGVDNEIWWELRHRLTAPASSPR